MATPDDIQKQLASRQPKVTPVGDVPAATARANAPSAMDVPSATPTAQATAAPAQARLTSPPDFIGDAAGGVQRNTPSSNWSTTLGASSGNPSTWGTEPGAGGAAPISRSAAQITEAPAWQTSPGAGAPAGTIDAPAAPTRAVSYTPKPATAAPGAAPVTDPNDITADFQKRMQFEAQRRANLAAETAAKATPAPAAAAADATAAAPSAATEAANAAETVAADATKTGMVRRVLGSATRLAGPALRYAGPIASVATAGTRIAGAEGDAYRNAKLTGASETAARSAADTAGGLRALDEGGGLAGGVAGARMGAMIPGPAWVKAAGGLVGGVVGSIGGQRAVEKLTGDDDSKHRLPDGVYQMPGMDDVPRMTADGQPARTPLNTDVLRLQQGGKSAMADFDSKFGAGSAAYYMNQKAGSNAATALNMSVSAYHPANAAAPATGNAAAPATAQPANAQPKVNFITPDNPTGIRPPAPAGAAARVAMNSATPGTAVINGRVLSAKEIADAGKRLNIVPSSAFTNPDVGDLYSQTHGGATPTSDQAIALRNSLNGSASAQRMFGTDASGNPVGVSGGIGAPQDPRQSTIQGLMGQISDALRSGRRRTAKILVDQLSAFDRASQGDMDNSLRRDALNKPQQPAPQTAAQQALDAARAGAAQTQEQVEQMSLAQAKQAQQIQAALQIETDPGKRKVLQQNLAAITGKGGSSANQLKMANFTVRSDLGTRTIPVPIDMTTGRPVISPEYIQLIQSLQGGQPQAPQKG